MVDSVSFIRFELKILSKKLAFESDEITNIMVFTSIVICHHVDVLKVFLKIITISFILQILYYVPYDLFESKTFQYEITYIYYNLKNDAILTK